MLESRQSAALQVLVLGEFQEHTVLKTRSFIIAVLASEKLKALFIIKQNPNVVVRTIVEIQIFENNTIFSWVKPSVPDASSVISST